MNFIPYKVRKISIILLYLIVFFFLFLVQFMGTCLARFILQSISNYFAFWKMFMSIASSESFSFFFPKTYSVFSAATSKLTFFQTTERIFLQNGGKYVYLNYIEVINCPNCQLFYFSSYDGLN